MKYTSGEFLLYHQIISENVECNVRYKQLCLKIALLWLRLECYIIYPQLAKELLKSYKFNSPIDVFLNTFTKEIYLLKNEITYPGDSRKDSDTL